MTILQRFKFRVYVCHTRSPKTRISEFPTVERCLVSHQRSLRIFNSKIYIADVVFQCIFGRFQQQQKMIMCHNQTGGKGVCYRSIESAGSCAQCQRLKTLYSIQVKVSSQNYLNQSSSMHFSSFFWHGIVFVSLVGYQWQLGKSPGNNYSFMYI